MREYFINNNSEEIIIFLNGWGSDENPLKHLKSNKDILILSDYTKLNLDFNFSKYKKKYLIAYSAGVFMSGYLAGKLPQVDYKIAINGTQKFADEKFGLTKNIIAELEKVDLYNYIDFRKNFIVNDNRELIKFNKNQPKRTLQNTKEELEALRKYSAEGSKDIPFDKILISQNDSVIPCEVQKDYWRKNYKIIGNAAHFPFFKFETYEEIIEY